MTTSARPPVRQLPPAARPSVQDRLRGVFTLRRVVSSVALSVAFAVMLVACWESQDGGVTARQGRPAAVLRVFPAEGASSLRQEPIGAQLADEFTGEVEVDGRPIPLDQTERPPVATGDNTAAPRGLSGLNQISFTPGAGKEITSLAPGTHTARILYWRKVGETRERAASYAWTFRAS